MDLMKAELTDNELDLFSLEGSVEEASPGEDEIRGEEEILRLLQDFPLEKGLKFHLKTEAFLLPLAYANNKILSLSNSRTRILAHQVESTHRIVNALRHRFLIADEVGLGKTVEAGLVLKEFIYRYNYQRILIACPASLLYQWQHEMKSKFNEEFTIIDRKVLNRAQKEAGEKGNPWMFHDRVICSLDFIKNDAFREDLKETPWDAVVFDEAHRLRRDAAGSTQAFVMAEIVAARTRALLLLSATPFRGKLEELYFLISLLDKNILGPFQSFSHDYCIEGADVSSLREKISEVVIRRTKNEVGGFTKRHARTVKFDLYPDERLLYDETTRYVVEEFNRALQTENRAVGFVMTVFQKLLDSSSHALERALRNRLAKLKDMVERAEGGSLITADLRDHLDPDEIDDEQVDSFVDLSLEKTVAELKAEIKVISRLILLAEKIECDKKGEKLCELLASLQKKGRKKFIIFTQFRTTQDYLAGLLKDYDVVVFNGSMSAEEKEQAIIDFKERAEIIIATEAGGEGRNMQFCDVLINYDLPWSPLKIEQRIGRIHRFGQARDVMIFNFSTSDTVAERVLEVLTRKLKLFEESIGPPDIMLGQIEDELKLNDLFMEMAAGRKKSAAVNREIDERVQAARKHYEKLADLTVARRMDFNYDEYYRITLKEREFTSRRIERFVELLQEEDDFALQHLAKRHRGNNLFPVRYSDDEVKGKYGTFDSKLAMERENLEFLAFGHPIVDTLFSYARGNDFGGRTGLKVIRGEGTRELPPGLLFNYIVTFESVRKTRELMTVVVFPDLVVDSFSLADFEREAIEEKGACQLPPHLNNDDIDALLLRAPELMADARERLQGKISDRVMDMCDNLDFQVDPELEKVRESYGRTIRELEEKLELQESRMKWYGKDMRGAITRTRNRIMKARREREHLIETLKGYLGVKHSAEMVNACVLIVEK